MKRKRMIKLMMAMGCDRNDAVRAADMCDGDSSHVRVLLWLILDFRKAVRESMIQEALYGSGDGEPVGLAADAHHA